MSPITIANVFLVTGLIAWGWRDHRQADALRQQLARTKAAADGYGKAAGLKLSLAARAGVNPWGLRGRGGPMPMEEGSVHPVAEKGKNSLAPGDPEGSVTPKQKELMMEFLKEEIRNKYEPLFKRMKLNAAKKDEVLKIMYDHLRVMSEAVGADGLNPASGKAAAEKSKAAKSKYEAALRTALGEKSAAFERFENSAQERSKWMAMQPGLKSRGTEFDDETEAKLLDTMYEVRSGWKLTHDFSDPMNVDPSLMTKEAVDRFLEESVKMQAAVREKVKKFLSPEQFEAFSEELQMQHKFNQMSLKLWGNSDSPGSNAPKAD